MWSKGGYSPADIKRRGGKALGRSPPGKAVPGSGIHEYASRGAVNSVETECEEKS